MLGKPKTTLALVIVLAAVLVAFLSRWYVTWRPFVDERAEPNRSPDVAHYAGNAAVGADPRQALIVAPAIRDGWHADDAAFDPGRDGWESEAIAESVKKQLEGIAALASRPRRLDAESLEAYVTTGFACARLRPLELRTVWEDHGTMVRRRASPGGVDSVPVHRGSKGLADALLLFAGPLRSASDIRVHTKVFGVSATETAVTTAVDVESHGRIAGGAIQQNATWICNWTRQATSPPRLVSIRAEEFEEIIARAAGGPWFQDCTESVLGRDPSYGEQIVYGLNHWLRRVPRANGMQIYARTGLAVGDVNGDGLDDVYLCQPGGLPNRLYVQNHDGTATDRSRWAGVDWLEHTSSALLVDLDNDGDQDLALATTAGLLLMENDASGQFRLRSRLPMERSVESLSSSDYDNDGDLDLYVCVYRSDPEANENDVAEDFVYHDANNGGENRLFRNEIAPAAASWQFTDVTRECGLDQANHRWSMASSWEDYDNDGDQDLYVANDYGQNCLYRNDNGHFAEVAQRAGVVDFGSGMSVCWGDYNHDGWMDLYVGNMFSSAGRRIAAQPQFQPGADASVRLLYHRFAKGNSLFQNVDGTRFLDVGAGASVEMARWAWSSLFVDINNDSWDDLVVANGFITADDPRDL